MSAPMTKDRFRNILPFICGRGTSFDPSGWTKDNPLWGHGAVVSLLAHSLFEGQIWGVDLRETKLVKMQFHFWNWFPDDTTYGTQEDFTISQFGDDYPGDLLIKWIDASWLLSFPDTLRRFKLLQKRFEAESKK